MECLPRYRSRSTRSVLPLARGAPVAAMPEHLGSKEKPLRPTSSLPTSACRLGRERTFPPVARGASVGLGASTGELCRSEQHFYVPT